MNKKLNETRKEQSSFVSQKPKVSVKAEMFVPDSSSIKTALERTTHMGIGAHQDDLEIGMYAGILQCFEKDEDWFFGVTVTDGGGSPRSGPFADYTDEEMKEVRCGEQKEAAVVGKYSGVALLNWPSSAVKEKNPQVIEEIRYLIEAARPHTVYTHNLADKHDTHVAVALRTIEAIRQLPEDSRPKALYGCEVWKDLDWMADEEKVVFDVSSNQKLAENLLGVYDSQIAGGKRYDLATLGRRRANVTYYATHGVDISEQAIFAMDLTQLVKDRNLSPTDYVSGYINRFASEVQERLKKFS